MKPTLIFFGVLAALCGLVGYVSWAEIQVKHSRCRSEFSFAKTGSDSVRVLLSDHECVEHFDHLVAGSHQ